MTKGSPLTLLISRSPSAQSISNPPPLNILTFSPYYRLISKLNRPSLENSEKQPPPRFLSAICYFLFFSAPLPRIKPNYQNTRGKRRSKPVPSLKIRVNSSNSCKRAGLTGIKPKIISSIGVTDVANHWAYQRLVIGDFAAFDVFANHVAQDSAKVFVSRI